MYFFWRDLAVVRGDSPFLSRFPTYLNFRNPIDVAVGPGIGRWTGLFDWCREWFIWAVPWSKVVLGMLGAPKREFKFPRDL